MKFNVGIAVILLFLFNIHPTFAITGDLLSQKSHQPLAIFGEDNRQEIFNVTPFWQNLARSVAGRVSVQHLNPGKTELHGQPLSKRVCPSTRFADQITVPSCTGFLVKNNILVTAGHCMMKEEDCKDYVWVFDYALRNEGDKDYTHINPQQVYRCEKVISHRFEDFGAVDYTLIQLDRPVTDRNPLTLGFDAPLTPGTSLAIIGHPNGLPLKFADQGQIIALTEEDRTIATNLDVFKGNSGAPVFEAQTGVVVGVTSHGHADHIRDPDKLCKINKVCGPNDTCYWSSSSRVKNMQEEPIFNASFQE